MDGKLITVTIKNKETQEERTYHHEIEVELCKDLEQMDEEISD